MNKNAPIILGIIAALFGAFMIVGNMPVTVEDFEGNLTVDGNLNVTGTGEFGDDVDMNLNYILYSPFDSWIHVDFAAGATNVELFSIPAGIHSQDVHYTLLMCSVGTAPGADKFVNVSITDGTNTMTISITGADKSESTTTGAFDLDVSTEALTIKYSQTGGGASDEACIMLHWYYKENE